MRARRRLRGRSTIAVIVLAAAACGGGDDATEESVDDTVAATPVTDVPGDTAGPDSGEIDSIEEIRPAVVQISAQGSYRDPVEGMQASGWSGSGFIIDPDGIVVTNNHVVTGAGVVKVVLEDGEELPARVLGVSECNDLAVLEIVDPGPYPSLSWYEGEIVAGLGVYTAGFPLGDPEFTITRGVVSKAEADGASPWSDARHVIEHDAAIQPGNSGGPLVGEEARVVGVNYQNSDPGTGTMQYFAIAADIAAPVVEQLRSGDAETIGVNGQAFLTEDGTGGVWVSAVEPGAPASEAGVLPGDIITELNGVPLSVGTMEPYCDVLRTANPGDPIRIEVYRVDSDEVWAGELYGDAMSVRFSFAEEFEGNVADEPTSEPSGAYSYDTLTDDTGTIVVSVPTQWSQRETAPVDLGLTTGPVAAIRAAPDLAAFDLGYDAPGMLMFGAPAGASEVGTPSDVLTLLIPDDPTCTSNGRSPYEDGAFAGELESWACGSGSVWIGVAANPIEAPDALVVIGGVAVTEADLEALDEILWSFNFA